MQKLGMEEGEAIEHPWVTKAIERAQRKVEAHNFDIRKNLLEYDDVGRGQDPGGRRGAVSDRRRRGAGGASAGGGRAGGDLRAVRAEGGAERAVSLWVGEEVQALSWAVELGLSALALASNVSHHTIKGLTLRSKPSLHEVHPISA
jgi:hypothetical protein